MGSFLFLGLLGSLLGGPFYKGAVLYWDLRRGPNVENYPHVYGKLFQRLCI